MSARIDILLALLDGIRRNAARPISDISVRDARTSAFRIVAAERNIDQRSVIDTYREQLRPYVEGTAAFDALVLDWLSTDDRRLERILLDRSDGLDRERVIQFFGFASDNLQRSADTTVQVRSRSQTMTAPLPPPETPVAADIAEPPESVRRLVSVYRVLRDTPSARTLKALYEHECQICGQTIELDATTRYSEAHHIRPLGSPHDGPDLQSNMLVVCPNDHARLDLGTIRLDLPSMTVHPRHNIDAAFLEYHNTRIYRQPSNERCN